MHWLHWLHWLRWLHWCSGAVVVSSVVVAKTGVEGGQGQSHQHKCRDNIGDPLRACCCC
jgi:hypothetical protein